MLLPPMLADGGEHIGIVRSAQRQTHCTIWQVVFPGEGVGAQGGVARAFVCHEQVAARCLQLVLVLVPLARLIGSNQTFRALGCNALATPTGAASETVGSRRRGAKWAAAANSEVRGRIQEPLVHPPQVSRSCTHGRSRLVAAQAAVPTTREFHRRVSLRLRLGHVVARCLGTGSLPSDCGDGVACGRPRSSAGAVQKALSRSIEPLLLITILIFTRRRSRRRRRRRCTSRWGGGRRRWMHREGLDVLLRICGHAVAPPPEL
mmetsp:Transcript_47429/g.151220  ORF Transcript_47429/g.151220 Transcript_47429/m.151220 type:complete len:262 (+) Transcript_47429:348-1133(+)